MTKFKQTKDSTFYPLSSSSLLFDVPSSKAWSRKYKASIDFQTDFRLNEGTDEVRFGLMSG